MDVEVLRSEFDAGGYDLVLSWRSTTRHIQMKSVIIGGKTASTKASLKLMEKPSGCIIWPVLNHELNVNSYLWFGGRPGERLPDISNYRVAKHTKANSKGAKLERPNHRIIPRGKFIRLPDLDSVLDRLFDF
ncbi:hypothetical protein P7D22_15245 [Lichenihabitans sp. Uapishka_5]|uniref:hypothetical protein n=1 Tax=Lichenihabitans sp. Uapishka_5 TaxID=3037302 RepID=UPI0029E7EA8E|nr:hypothetical protein [Lichenihabitans sp. Uapishka_5]MDX7952524.1 hypothetical protein [Lichenihabitans sp. Uapishka_5]